MNKEEVENRILICEERERSYREVGNTRIADKYSNEKYKWEKLLSKLDSKKDEELRDYKIGYTNLKQALNEIRCYINKNTDSNPIDNLTYKLFIYKKEEYEFIEDILQIIEKYLGDSDEKTN